MCATHFKKKIEEKGNDDSIQLSQFTLNYFTFLKVLEKCADEAISDQRIRLKFVCVFVIKKN